MGLVDFLKGRRERESATHGLSTGLDPSQQVQAEGGVGPFAPASAFDSTPPAQPGQAAEIDWAQLAQIGPMIQRAIQSGNVQISQGEPQSIDLRGSGDLQQILDALSQAGVDLGEVSFSAGESPG